MNCSKFLHVTNVPKHVLNQVVGKSHPLWSRLLLGFLIMLCSSFIAESFVVFAAIRELIHAIGAIPWLEWFSANAEEKIVENKMSKSLDSSDKGITFELQNLNIMKKTNLVNAALILGLILIFIGTCYIMRNKPQMKAEDALLTTTLLTSEK